LLGLASGNYNFFYYFELSENLAFDLGKRFAFAFAFAWC
jgi:hypothetical protein